MSERRSTRAQWRDPHEPLVQLAMRIAWKYPYTVPSWQELVDDFGMSRATAYRWRRALSGARSHRGATARLDQAAENRTAAPPEWPAARGALVASLGTRVGGA